MRSPEHTGREFIDLRGESGNQSIGTFPHGAGGSSIGKGCSYLAALRHLNG